MSKKLLATAVLIATLANGVLAQDSTKSLTISGSLDAYYRYNFANNNALQNNYNNYTSFTNSQNSFELGMASIRADASAMSGKVGGTIDLGFGRRAEEFSYNDNTSSFVSLANVKQLFVTFAPSSKVKFTMGKFGTHVGYELLDAPLNRNYSMSYMFTNGPFFHTGLKMDVTAGPLGFMLGVSNYTDQSTSTSATKTLLGQISGGTSDGKIKAFFNFVGSFGSTAKKIPGDLENLSQYDLVVTAALSNKFSLGVNGTIQSRDNGVNSGSWKGAAVYLNADPTDMFGITLRSEYISDNELIYFSSTKHIFANTLSVNIKAGPLTFIPELRVESAEGAIYSKNDGTTTKSTATGLLAAVYKF